VTAVKIIDDSTGCAFITVDENGENAITVASGANMEVCAADVPDELISAASVVVLQMEVPLSENLEVARRAKRDGATIIWNVAPAPAFLERDVMAEMLAVTDVLVVNQHEAISVAACMGEDAGSDYLKASSILARSHGLVCIVTAGSRGAFAAAPDGTQRHAAALPVKPADTTGAGDTFVGVLACGLAEGREMAEAMHRACVAASLSCLTPGAQAGMPSRDALEKSLSG